MQRSRPLLHVARFVVCLSVCLVCWPGHINELYTKADEPIDMHNMRVHGGVAWRIRMSGACAAAMRPCHITLTTF